MLKFCCLPKNAMKYLFAKSMDVLSGQWIVDWMDANGGDVVVLRSIFVGTLLTLVCIGVQALVDPNLVGPVSVSGFQYQLTDLGAVIGAIYVGSYAALYARFVSQWSYLAGVYNQIKQAESNKDCDQDVIAQWKAGYIEDAQILHLMRKASVAPIIVSWGKNSKVEAAYVDSTPGGRERWDAVMTEVRKVTKDEARRRG